MQNCNSRHIRLPRWGSAAWGEGFGFAKEALYNNGKDGYLPLYKGQTWWYTNWEYTPIL
jgi:hypothetical protein